MTCPKQSIFGQSILIEWKIKGIPPKHLPVYLYICPLKSASSNAKRRELKKPELDAILGTIDRYPTGSVIKG